MGKLRDILRVRDDALARDGIRELVESLGYKATTFESAESAHAHAMGLVPSRWSKPLKELKLATFNARAETVAEKPFFRKAFKRNCCAFLRIGNEPLRSERLHRDAESRSPGRC
jgi:SOS response associated peptidase (SRAP)